MNAIDTEKRREALLREVRLRMLGTGTEAEATRLEKGLVMLLREPDEEQPIDQSRIHALNRERASNAYIDSNGRARPNNSGPITPPACRIPIRFHPLGTHIGCHGGNH